MSAVQQASGTRTRRELRRLLRSHVGGVTIAVIALAAAATLAVAVPLLLGRVVDVIVSGDAAAVTQTFVGLAVVVVLQAVCAAWSRGAIARVAAHMIARLRGDVVDHVLRLPVHRVEAAGRGEVVSRVTGDVSIVSGTVSNVLPATAGAAFLLVASAAGLGALDPRLAAAALIAVPLQYAALRLYLRRSQPLYRSAREAAGQRSQRALEAIDGHETLVAFAATAHAIDRVDEPARRSRDLALESNRWAATFWGRLNTAEFAGLAAILIVAFLLVRTGSLTVGAATAAALLFMQLFGPIGIVLSGVDDLQRASISLARLVGVLDEPPCSSHAEHASLRRGAVRLRDVSHQYGDRRVLADVSLTIEPGTQVAVVGASGAGKSTLGALIGGDLVAHAGVVERGPGTRVATVSQEGHVFDGTLREDLRLALPGADDAALWRALGVTGLDDWARGLVDGLDAVIGVGGERVSGERAQQLALARAWLADPDVLVLDEATSQGAGRASAVDEAAGGVAQGRTSIVIAHRLDQAARADLVVVMDDGRIVETGTPGELLRRNGEFARLWEHAGYPRD